MYRSIELLHQPTLMHSFLYSLTICLLHYYLRHVSSINMPIFRRKNCIQTASGIFALCKRLHSTLVESGLSPLSTSVLGRRLQVNYHRKNSLLTSEDQLVRRGLGQCFSSAGPRPGTGPWHQLYRAARGSPGICHFSFLRIFH